MATAAAPIRLDRELAAAARDAALTMSRSVAEQVSHWARLGRELERSPNVSVAQVQSVLRGDAPYDSLGVQAQAVVRAHWDESLAATLATLNLADAFAAEGHRYAELGADGQISVSAPSPKPRTRTPTTAATAALAKTTRAVAPKKRAR